MNLYGQVRQTRLASLGKREQYTACIFDEEPATDRRGSSRIRIWSGPARREEGEAIADLIAECRLRGGVELRPALFVEEWKAADVVTDGVADTTVAVDGDPDGDWRIKVPATEEQSRIMREYVAAQAKQTICAPCSDPIGGEVCNDHSPALAEADMPPEQVEPFAGGKVVPLRIVQSDSDAEPQTHEERAAYINGQAVAMLEHLLERFKSGDLTEIVFLAADDEGGFVDGYTPTLDPWRRSAYIHHLDVTWSLDMKAREMAAERPGEDG